MKSFTYSLLFLFITGAFLSSCKKDDETEPEKDPVYTTVSLKFTNKANASDVQNITYKDMDNEGPLLPTFSTLQLKANSEYSVEVTAVNDETNSSNGDLLNIIERDNTNYLFVYGVFLANLGFSTANYDSNNMPLGTEARANTGGASNGNFILTLVKNPLSKEDSEIQGQTMFEYTFPVEIK